MQSNYPFPLPPATIEAVEIAVEQFSTPAVQRYSADWTPTTAEMPLHLAALLEWLEQTTHLVNAVSWSVSPLRVSTPWGRQIAIVQAVLRSLLRNMTDLHELLNIAEQTWRYDPIVVNRGPLPPPPVPEAPGEAQE